MKFTLRGKRFVLALAAGLSLALVGSDAMAWSYGSSGSWGSSGSSGSYGSSGSWGGSSGSYGSHGGLFSRIRARRAARQAYASSGSYGSSGSSGSYGSSGSSGSSGSYGVTYTSQSPVYYSAAKPATGAATVNVKVPEDAVVVVNDSRTTSTGQDRSYVSRGLKSGMTYTYNFEVTYKDQNDKPVTKQETVKLAAGDVVELEFGTANQAANTAEATQPVETKLTVEVPEDAKIFLLGTETLQTGSLRTFTTRQLKAGEEWAGYQIRVELDHEGKTLVREQELELEGGQTYELAFDFDLDSATQIAQLSR